MHTRNMVLVLATAMMLVSPAAHAKPKFVTFMVDGQSTTPTSINAKGAVTGVWFQGGIAHGFVRQSDGTIETFDVPNATRGTFPTSINKKGETTGYYQMVYRRGT